MRSRRDPNRFARSLFDGLPARYDALAEVLSFGQNRRWRAAMVDRLARPVTGPSGVAPRPLGRGDRVLDVATGTAGVAVALSARTGAKVVGIDLTEAMLRRGRQRVDQVGLSSDRPGLAPVSTRGSRGPMMSSGAASSDGVPVIDLLVGRGEQLPFPDGTFDGLTFTYLLRYVADPAGTLAELARVVRPGGVVSSLEFHAPDRTPWRPLWWLYTRLVLPVAGFLLGGREWYRVGRFLGPSISEHYRSYPDSWALQAWRDAGLVDVGLQEMSVGGGVVMWGRRDG